MGLRASPTTVALEDMRVPADALLGEEGMGFIYAMQSLDDGRLGIAAQAIGIARRALELAVAYCAERRQFGKPIHEFQAIQFKLADMATRVAAAARADAIGRGRRRIAARTSRSSARMAKLLATRDGDVGHDAGHPDLRRLRLREGLSGRATLPRREGHRDLRRHLRRSSASSSRVASTAR